MHLIRCTLNDIGHSGIYPERKKNLKPILMDLTMGSKSALIQIFCKNFKIQKFLYAICWRLKYRKKYLLTFQYVSGPFKQMGLMPCLKTIFNCFALEHSAFKTKHLKMS